MALICVLIKTDLAKVLRERGGIEDLLCPAMNQVDVLDPFKAALLEKSSALPKHLRFKVVYV